jgi:hypothetical protein
MENILPIIAAVVFGNVLSAAFGYGMFRAFQVKSFGELNGAAKACLLMPLAYVALIFIGLWGR